LFLIGEIKKNIAKNAIGIKRTPFPFVKYAKPINMPDKKEMILLLAVTDLSEEGISNWDKKRIDTRVKNINAVSVHAYDPQ